MAGTELCPHDTWEQEWIRKRWRCQGCDAVVTYQMLQRAWCQPSAATISVLQAIWATAIRQASQDEQLFAEEG